jgi:response regulator RpfG family c-di-GMP phosphodiesterase
MLRQILLAEAARSWLFRRPPERPIPSSMNTTNGSRTIRVLVVDDDPRLCEFLRVTLELEGIEVWAAHHVIEAEKVLADAVPDVLVLDIGLPGVDGVFYCERLRESARTRIIPIVAISGSEDAGVRALTAGANVFLHKPIDPVGLIDVVERLAGAETIEARRDGDDGERRRLLHIGQRQHDLLLDSYRETLETLVDALEARERGAFAHSRRVAAYATRVTLELDASLLDDPSLEWGFLLHDVGKIGIPDEILHKRGPLTRPERLRLNRHPLIGEGLVGHLPLLQGAGVEVIRSHHERWDGQGYPDRTTQSEIPLAARIFAGADTLEALTRPADGRGLPWADAFAVLVRTRASHLDPDVADALIACEPDLHDSYTRLRAIAA